jgi:hypothetical protein
MFEHVQKSFHLRPQAHQAWRRPPAITFLRSGNQTGLEIILRYFGGRSPVKTYVVNEGRRIPLYTDIFTYALWNKIIQETKRKASEEPCSTKVSPKPTKRIETTPQGKKIHATKMTSRVLFPVFQEQQLASTSKLYFDLARPTRSFPRS